MKGESEMSPAESNRSSQPQLHLRETSIETVSEFDNKEHHLQVYKKKKKKNYSSNGAGEVTKNQLC